jgi:hypothetical protein
VVGTLRYLPPERFNGVTDARGDVYALGLTLYEMLTLRPGFEQADRVELLYAIARQSPPRPRQIEPRIPRDLETIILKATEKDPTERFASAADLPEELRRFLADETLRIRRTGPLERLRSWRRHNPVVASLSLAVALLLGVALVGLVVALLVSAERDRALANLERAERAEAKARQAEQEVNIREHLARAAAHRRSGQVGQRFRSLGELTRALRLDPPAELRREIRDEAVAALVLPDVEVAREWEGWPEGTVQVGFDATLQRFARLDGQGGRDRRPTDGDRGGSGQAVVFSRSAAVLFPVDEPRRPLRAGRTRSPGHRLGRGVHGLEARLAARRPGPDRALHESCSPGSLRGCLPPGRPAACGRECREGDRHLRSGNRPAHPAVVAGRRVFFSGLSSRRRHPRGGQRG